jgi:hypothetical protein
VILAERIIAILDQNHRIDLEHLKNGNDSKKIQNAKTVSDQYKQTYALAPIATASQLTTPQSDQVQIFFLIYTSSGRELKKRREVLTPYQIWSKFLPSKDITVENMFRKKNCEAPSKDREPKRLQTTSV